MIKNSGAALCDVSLSIPSPQLYSLPSTLYSLHPLPPRIRPRRHSRAVTPADEMMSHMFDVYCLYLGGGYREGILSSQNTTIHFSNYWIWIRTLTPHDALFFHQQYSQWFTESR